MIKIISVVGARPNFMKVAPLHRHFSTQKNVSSIIVHTGQHYDEKMSDIFFNQLELPKPNYYLGIGGGSHTWQKANVMLKFEEIVLEEKPDIVLVVGDVNATAACAIVAVKMGIKTVHVEAGLRSGDRAMPEEINRIITDSISDLLFITEQSGIDNLKKEGVPDEKVKFVGNVMIDSLIYYREKAGKLELSEIVNNSAIKEKEYVLMTMHRPSNVDTEQSLLKVIEIIKGVSKDLPIVFPMHPRTKNNLEKYKLYQELSDLENLEILGPQGYLQFLKLMDNAKLVITDSGGIQEETTYLQVPCITFRDSTERPVTVDLGTNILMEKLNVEKTLHTFKNILAGKTKEGVIPPFWDGKTSERIYKILSEI